MSTLWIVHRDARERAALARLAAAEDAVRGAPGEPHFDAAPTADLVLLGLPARAGSDPDDGWEPELEFAHRHRARLGGARWILLGARDDRDAALALFDRVVAEFVPYPPPAGLLRQRIRTGTRRHLDPLSQRARRAAVAARFSRWLADLEIPELLRAMDPRLGELPLRVRGEPGTGRGALVRYVHYFGVTAEGALAHLPCAPDRQAAEIAEALVELSRARGPLATLCIWLDEVDRLGRGVQRELREWIEVGPPPGVRAARLRWVATQDETGDELEPGLAHALGKLEIRLPPLRERPGRVEAIAGETARTWAAARREPVRRFAEDALAVLEEYPWPGNLRELETAVEQTLASGSADPIRADDLRLDGQPFAPVDAGEFGTLLADEDEAGEATAVPDAVGTQVAAGAPAALPVAREAEAPAPRPVERPAPERTPARPSPVVAGEATLGRLAEALSHEVRNPLATIRTFAGLLPERFDDPEFRARFTEMVNEDVQRIDGLIARLEQLANLDMPDTRKVDVSALLEELLQERRDAFRDRHLLVLKELDSSHPLAEADPRQLRVAFEALLDTALECVPERGDVYIASRHHDGGASAAPSMRVLLRFHDPHARAPEPGLPAQERSLAMIVAELLVRAQGGRLTLAASEGEERVVVVDIPAP